MSNFLLEEAALGWCCEMESATIRGLGVEGQLKSKVDIKNDRSEEQRIGIIDKSKAIFKTATASQALSTSLAFVSVDHCLSVTQTFCHQGGLATFFSNRFLPSSSSSSSSVYSPIAMLK